MGLQRDSRALAADRERQISRWLHNPKIKADVVYRDLVTAALLPWAEQTAWLALDSSVLWEKYVLRDADALARLCLVLAVAKSAGGISPEPWLAAAPCSPASGLTRILIPS